MLKWLESWYGKMRISIGKVHDYLGMDLDCSVQGGVSAKMEKYVSDTIKEFSEDTTASVAMPAADHLLDVRDMSVRLEKEEEREFHRAT